MDGRREGMKAPRRSKNYNTKDFAGNEVTFHIGKWILVLRLARLVGLVQR